MRTTFTLYAIYGKSVGGCQVISSPLTNGGSMGGFDLETRKCACNCGNTFRCLPSSKAQYAALSHMPDEERKQAMATRPAKKKKMKEKGWSYYVNEAKKYIQQIQQYQIKIAHVALKACDIRHGGNHKDYQKIITMKRFAREIGISYKSLTEYVRITRNVYNKLTKEQKKDGKYEFMRQISIGLNKDSSRQLVREKYDYQKNIGQNDYYIQRFLRRLQTAHHFYCKKIDQETMKKLSQNELKKTLSLCEDITHKIKQVIQ